VDQHAQSWQTAFRAFGHDIPFAEIRGQIGKGGDQLMPVFLSKAALEAKGADLDRRRGAILKDTYLPSITGFPGVQDLLRRLRADGLRIVLASSAKAEELAHYKQLLGISDLVDAATSSEDADRSKPHPDIFQAALDRLSGIEPQDAVVIGDTPYDALAAAEAGMRTIGVLCGGFAERDLRDAGCIAIFADPADLLRDYDRFKAVMR
jgi:phosphoglycolate phosphatase-like HAD superfamily hydrolase